LSGVADLNAYASLDYSALSSVYGLQFSVSDGSSTASANTSLSVIKESADVAYTGLTSFSTSSLKSTSASVLLEAMLWDDSDGLSGNITSGKVQFSWVADSSYNSGNPIPWTYSSWQNVSRLNADNTRGYSSFSASLSSGGSSRSYVVRAVAGGNYAGETTGEQLSIVTVIQNGGTGFLGGGGTIGSRDVLTGAYFGKYGELSGGFINFGFNTKYNKSGTNLLGNTTILIRGHFDDDLIVGGDVDIDTYLVKSNATDTLTKNADGTYTFTAKANIFDTDNANAVIASNLAMKALGFDAARTASTADVDAFSFSLSANTGELLFSTGYSGVGTTSLDLQTLNGGNIHAG